MTHRFTSFLSVLVLALTMVFASSTLAAGMEPTMPNRTLDGGSGDVTSGVVACQPTLLTAAATSVPSGPAGPPTIHSSAIVVEQDTGAIFVLTTEHAGGATTAGSPAGTLAESTATGCLSTISAEDQPFSGKPR